MTWKRIVDWAKNHVPELHNSLSSGIQCHSRQSISGLSFDLPSELVETYAVTNGQVSEFGHGLLLGLQQHSLADSLNHTAFFCQSIADEPELYEEEHGASEPAGKIVNAYMDSHRFAIASSSAGEYIGLDYNPDSRGIIGQVISFGRHVEIRYVLASNVAQFYDRLYTLLENREIIIKKHEYGVFTCYTTSGELIDDPFRFFYHKFNS